MKGSNGIELPPLDARNRAWLVRGDRPVLGERHLAILEAVRDLGSLNAAAKHLKISYRDAWGKIRLAEAALGVELIAAKTGGSHGGGSRLTPAGEQVVARLHGFHEEQRNATTRVAAAYFGGDIRGRRGEGLRLATTTSLVDSGLLGVLLPPFSHRMGVEIEVMPVGSGAALRLARAGRADVVLAHAPEAEERAVQVGDLLNRRLVMANEFVLVGPPEDPAQVRTAGDVGMAFQRIATARAAFWSRADRSGTYQREQVLLAAAKVTLGRWYHRRRVGMADLLCHANDHRAYALTDRGTFGALADRLSLHILYAGGEQLRNPYSVLAIDPFRHPGANYLGAMAFIGWLTAPAAQEIIAAYRVGGHPIAQPAARRP